MSSTELDLPILFSAEQIRRREFVTVRRGYDPDQVRDYLEQLAGQVDRMAAMIREARLQVASASSAPPPAHRTDAYEQLGRRVASVVREADETAARLRSQAQEETEGMLREARADADRIRTDAQAKAEEARAEADRALREARERADRTIAGLSTQREALVRQLTEMQERLLGVAHELETAIETPGPAESSDPSSRGVIDVRDPSSSIGADPHVAAPIDPSYEELWEGTETIHLQVPDIPPLDLSWDDEDEDPVG
ncbi:MAG TPA: DivIVA domain-containing protein [Actinomycetota bacterium]|nr:DivIVA domain-containing protein [Actinomycetota bacterium]